MQWMSLFLLCLWSKFQEFNETFLYYDIFLLRLHKYHVMMQIKLQMGVYNGITEVLELVILKLSTMVKVSILLYRNKWCVLGK